jgi:hypothetical protein
MGATGPEEILFRLGRIHNTAKHTEQMLVRAQRFEEGDTLAVWISNVGLTSKNYSLPFNELYDCLCGIAHAVAMLVNGEQQTPAQPVVKSA